MMSLSPHKLLRLPLILMILAKNGFGLISDIENPKDVRYLQEKSDAISISKKSGEKLEVFCHPGENFAISHFWTSAVFRLLISSDHYQVFIGPNATAVIEDYDQGKQSRFYNSFSSSTMPSKDIKLNPFLQTCVGIVATDNYRLILHIDKVNYWQVVMTSCGLLLFLYSRQLCRNVFLHYAAGVATGIAFFLLVCLYFVQKKVRGGFFGWILGLYSLLLYMRDYLIHNQDYLLGYLVISGTVSFALCYRMGPIKNPRTLNLIQWALQLFALILIYMSSYHQVASLALCLGVLAWTFIN